MKAHGTYMSEVHGNIIIFSLSGGFNESGILSCLKSQKREIEEFGKNECYLLVDCCDQIGATPEAYELVNQFYNDLNATNLAAIAMVHCSYVLARLEEREISGMKSYNVRVFFNKKAALTWVHNLANNTKSQYRDYA